MYLVTGGDCFLGTHLLNKIPKNQIKIDKNKLRILNSTRIASKLTTHNSKFKAQNSELIPAIVTEYPTWGATEIEIDFI